MFWFQGIVHGEQRRRGGDLCLLGGQPRRQQPEAGLPGGWAGVHEGGRHVPGAGGPGGGVLED